MQLTAGISNFGFFFIAHARQLKYTYDSLSVKIQLTGTGALSRLLSFPKLKYYRTISYAPFETAIALIEQLVDCNSFLSWLSTQNNALELYRSL